MYTIVHLSSGIMTEEEGTKVQVYIYDLSMGLAAQLSPLFLGKGPNPLDLIKFLIFV